MQTSQTECDNNIQCNEQAFPEFPNLLFGTQIESGISYFDATLYLQKCDPQLTIDDFCTQYKVQIQALIDAYEIKQPIIKNKDHTLIDGNLVYLFISFVEPNFLAYMCDRLNEIMTTGVSVSDTYLLQSVKARLNPEIVNSIFDDETNIKQ